MELKLRNKIVWRIFALFLMNLLNNYNIYGYTNKIDTNFVDTNGYRQGFWRIYQDNLLTESYYFNDTLNGVYKTYYQNLKISSIGVYNMGLRSGVWFYFDEEGRLLLEISKIEIGLFKSSLNSNLTFSSRGYIKIFNAFGFCVEEGYALYDDPEYYFEKSSLWTFN